MGAGDAGFFTRSYNTEFINGVRVPVPEAKFAAYSSMKLATTIKFDKLRDRWPRAYQAVLNCAKGEETGSGIEERGCCYVITINLRISIRCRAN